jgi:hypothetical protein
MLGHALFASYGSRHDLRDACRRWSYLHAKECGTGFFDVKLDGWGLAGLKRGNHGYVKCRVKGCGWHLKIEEADAGVDSEGNPLVQVCVYDYNIAHKNFAAHVAVDATRVELANTPGWQCIPEELHDLARLCAGAGRSARRIVRDAPTEGARPRRGARHPRGEKKSHRGRIRQERRGRARKTPRSTAFERV